MRIRSLFVGSFLAFSVAYPVFAEGTFPPAEVDVFATGSGFSVTINGVDYLGLLSDSQTTVGRSGPISEATEGVPVPVPTGSCGVCQTTVADSDIDCWTPGSGGPGARREVHTEMLSLNMCGAIGMYTVCYLAGQPASVALAGVSGAAYYANTFGEVEAQNLTGDAANDFPANSLWAIRGVVTFDPAPPSTSGVFVTDRSILMMLNDIRALPPDDAYVVEAAGGVLEGGRGAACGALPAPLFDAGLPGGPLVGQINSGAQHFGIPALGTIGIIVMTLGLLLAGMWLLWRRRRTLTA